MRRRVVRIAAFGVCLLSLLLCLVTAWAWWRTRSGSSDDGFPTVDTAEASIGHTLFEAKSTSAGLWLEVVSDWPGPPSARFFSEALPLKMNGSPMSAAANERNSGWWVQGYFLGIELGERRWGHWPL